MRENSIVAIFPFSLSSHSCRGIRMNQKNIYMLVACVIGINTTVYSVPSAPSQKPMQKKESASTKKPSVKTVKQVANDDWFEVDSIKTVIFSDGESSLITASDVARPSVAGQMRTLEDIIFENLVFMDAKRHKIMTDDASVDRYLNAIAKENNLKPEQLKQIFAQSGYDFEEGRKELGKIQATNQMLDYQIRQNLIVPRSQVVRYYEEHPEIEEESYQLQTGFIMHTEGADKNAERTQVESFVAGSTTLPIQWSQEFWINKSDIASDQHFIYSMKPSQMELAQETPDGFIIYRLINRKEERLRSLDDRYLEIADILRKPRYEELLQKYRTQLFKDASIISF
jgi:parvulin-like peptidyl-prolyl isomerase